MKKFVFSALGLILILIIAGSSFLVFKFINKPVVKPPDNNEEIPVELPKVAASVKVDLKPKSGGKSVLLLVSEIPKDTESLEYELSYITGEGLPKGALGKINLDGKTEIERDILLGTCSRNTCTYDTGVKSVNLVLRFNNSQGASQFTKEYSFE